MKDSTMKQTDATNIFSIGQKSLRILNVADLRAGIIVRVAINQPATGTKNYDYTGAFTVPFWDLMVIRGNEINTEPHSVTLGRPYAQISDSVPGSLLMGYESIDYQADSNQTFLMISDVNASRPTLTDTSLFQAA